MLYPKLLSIPTVFKLIHRGCFSISKIKARQGPRLDTNFRLVVCVLERRFCGMSSKTSHEPSKSNEEIVSGGCHCKGVRFQFSKPILMLGICHCGDCRKLTGATVFDTVVLPRSKLKMISDSTLKSYRSSEHGIRKFCDNCGCSVGGESEMEEFKDIVYIARGKC